MDNYVATLFGTKTLNLPVGNYKEMSKDWRVKFG